MTYFSFYGLPISFHPPQDVVRKQYYALSKKYHPDFYANASVEKQEEVLQLSTENNKAYNVLTDPSKTLHYVLGLYEMLPEGEQYQLPQEFLMEMMDVNEQLMELEFEPDAARKIEVMAVVDDLQEGLESQLTALTTQFEDTPEDQRKVKLEKIKDLYFRMKYLARIREKV